MVMVKVNLPVFDNTQPQSKKFAKAVKTKTTGDSRLNNSPDKVLVSREGTYFIIP